MAASAVCVTDGLIPAHAGKTRRRFRRSYVMGAHPRSRGENANVRAEAARAGGSSPLTRGKLMVTAYNIRTGGLIPAHAGKTFAPVTPVLAASAHPRSRGENSFSADAVSSSVGSSPLTRGKRRTAKQA